MDVLFWSSLAVHIPIGGLAGTGRGVVVPGSGPGSPVRLDNSPYTWKLAIANLAKDEATTWQVKDLVKA